MFKVRQLFNVLPNLPRSLPECRPDDGDYCSRGMSLTKSFTLQFGAYSFVRRGDDDDDEEEKDDMAMLQVPDILCANKRRVNETTDQSEYYDRNHKASLMYCNFQQQTTQKEIPAPPSCCSTT